MPLWLKIPKRLMKQLQLNLALANLGLVWVLEAAEGTHGCSQRRWESLQLQTTARVVTMTTPRGKESQGRETEWGEVQGPKGLLLPSADTRQVTRMSKA